ncbi:MAG: sporulation protein [Acidovorax sp. SCN 65-28]|uniref:SPOR domain-containing protein n=1 Tax=Acidovorax sp. TaxID=1872122 RepID=UPI00086A8D32|nr:SPOR domain-containing protein [Acidovorax sp.]MBN9626345.1 SPOR domain-containing protein [Acidovorax sp.]ODS79979.1 MAG: sporulation protein [Acidovorax sp. SCN 65-28]OJU06285.1 MAG: sporulation protein [Acidovorax sp. 65-7]
MLDHTDPVASIIPAMSLDSPSDNAMAAMSRLALGPVNTDYYLKVFERFDDTGRTTTTWNWAACLCTLNWMLFRQLWGAALVYVAAAEGLALIVFGVGRSFLHWPVGIELGVLGAFAVLAFAVPGLYGNAILYADIRKRIARALAASRTVPEACALLEKQASSRKRLQVLVLANVVLGLAALIAYLALSPSDVKPLALEPAVTVAQATAAAQAASATHPVGALPAPKAEQTPATPPTPATEATATPVAPSAPAAASAPAPVAPAPAAVAPPAATTAAPKSTEPPASAPPAAAKASTPVTKASAPKPATPAASTRAPTAAASTQAPTRREAASRPVASAKPKAPAAAASSADTALPTVGTAPGYYINVGLFAEEANARKTQARLLNEGLPAFRQELNNSKGRRIRVRVGPYATRAQADTAAEAIRAMALDAVVFKQ